MAVKQKVVECVAQSPDVQLQLILRALQDAQGLQDKRICTDTIVRLGSIQVPKDLNKYQQFIATIQSVKESLIKECIKPEMINYALGTLYSEISSSDKVLSPAMSIVLQLIDEKHIPAAVEFILQKSHLMINNSQEGLKRALQTMCHWLTNWTWTENLAPLVLAFMRGLEAQQHYEILSEVTTSMIEKFFKLLILPKHRDSLGPIVLYMMSSPLQNNPEAFQKIISHMSIVIPFLRKENSQSSQYYLEGIVNAFLFLMNHYPEYSKLYQQVKEDLQEHLPTQNYSSQLVIKSEPWYDSTNDLRMQTAVGRMGLNNLGNTCYMNSVLQALFVTKLFRNEILLYNKDASPLLTKLQTLFALMQQSKRSSLSPTDLSNLARPPGFSPGHQHDSSEFLGYLLDVLHEQEKTAAQAGQSKSDQAASPYSTIVQKAFGGRTVSVSGCSECHTKSERTDNFWELQLSFPNNSVNQSVQTLLEYYLQTEKLCGDNKYHCEVCNCLTDGERVTCIEEAPPRLILTLKHFRYDQASQQRTKLLQTVKLDNHVRLEAGEYELYAAVVHSGSSLDLGHYYTFARDGDEWFKFNDCSVTRASSDELYSLMLPETAYILFYSRQDYIDPEVLPRTLLSQRLQLLINRDHAEFEFERRRRPLKTYSERQNRNDEPPPPGCGGSGFSNNSSNMYVC